MGKSQESFSKKEREKKKARKRKEKLMRKEERKARAEEGEGPNEFAYVDEYGNLSDTPPDPKKKKEEIDAEDIVIGVPKKSELEEQDPVKKGTVAFFNDEKGYGFIKEKGVDQKYFVHVTGLLEDVYENDRVTFELEKGPKGLNAVKVRKLL